MLAWGDISLVLTDDVGIARLNRLYRDRTEATDVISFACPPLPGGGTRYTGEIVVNIERAVAEGRKRGSVDRELALYIAHGCDHLSGQEDRSTPERRRMRERELKWLKKAEALKLVTHLLKAGR